MRYRRMIMEVESPEELGYDTIRNNLSESSVADRRLVRICDRSVAPSADSIEFWGIAADGGPIGSSLSYGADLYGLNWFPPR